VFTVETGFAYKQVIVLRCDLTMSVGKLISQACHASLEASEIAKRLKPRIWRRWRVEGAKKVIVKADSLEELRRLDSKARALKLPSALIVDRGLTQLPPGTTSALGIGPATASVVDRVTANLKLF
jgi:PTH2 family peptidyl-tRNA hydrolase